MRILHFNGAANGLPLLLAALVCLLPAKLRAATLTVTRATDTLPDGSPAPGSLRQAILDANAGVDEDTIQFSSAFVIAPTSELPPITNPIVLDGFVSGARVELNGAGAPAGASGLVISAGGCTIRGLVINRFKDHGLWIQGNGNNVVEGCYLGTDAAGQVAHANGKHGVLIDNAPDNRIGGVEADQLNLISGNTGNGVQITDQNATGNHIVGNFIGTDVTGGRALGNKDGVALTNAPANTIGGLNGEVRSGNVISGNRRDGINLRGLDRVGNIIQGNYIGTDADGAMAVPNEQNGIFSNRAAGTLIGGPDHRARNVISGNIFTGIILAQASAAGTTVQANYIGVDATGSEALPNELDGILITASPGVLIGGDQPEMRNVISGNAEDGLDIRGPLSTENVVQGNFIGTDADGRAAVGNFTTGITIQIGASFNTIGGATAGTGNVISGNGGIGLLISESNSQGNRVQGNLIGTDVTGKAALGNGIDGVSLEAGAFDNTIGGLEAGVGNVIAFNGGDGVFLFDASTGNAVLSNAIFGNDFLGINLALEEDDLATENDPGDADIGPNDFQNFPDLTSASALGGSTTIQGLLDSTPDMLFTLQFFASPACDEAGYGEGARYLGSATTTTSGAGVARFTVTLPAATTVGEIITATATDPGNNTSEFSQCVSVQPGVVDGNVVRIARSGDALTISFPKTATLETTLSLSAPNWTKVTETPTGAGDTVSVTLPATQPQSFFRLRLQ